MTVATYCTHCGSLLAPDNAFCVACGTSAIVAVTDKHFAPSSANGDGSRAPSAEAEEPQYAGYVPIQPASTLPPTGVTMKGGVNVVAVIACLLAGMFVIGAGGAIYGGLFLKRKASAAIGTLTARDEPKAGPPVAAPAQRGPSGEQALPPPDGVDSGLDAIGGIMDKMGFGDPPPDPYSDLKVVKPTDPEGSKCPAADPADVLHPTAGRIPFREGLIITATWGRKQGDVDSTQGVTAITPEAVSLQSSGLHFHDENSVVGTPGVDKRDVCAADMQRALGYHTSFAANYPLVSPGTTTEFLSAAAFRQLKSAGKVKHGFMELFDYEGDSHREHWNWGEVSRVEPEDIPYSVIVNDAIVTLPVIHARGAIINPDPRSARLGKSGLDQSRIAELKVLDDPLNPIVLLYKFDDYAFRVEVTKISYPNQEKRIEQELSKNKKAVVYGIYFDFNSDRIKPE